MPTHNLEDLLDEIQEDEVVDILLDTNELKGLLKAVAANDEIDMQCWLRVLQVEAKQIRERLVRKKYPTDFGSQD